MNASRVPADADGSAPVLRLRRIPVRVTDAEYAVLRAAATRAGRGQLAAWARRLLLDAASGRGPDGTVKPVGRETESGPSSTGSGGRDESQEVAELRRAVREMVRVGVNLNQCAHAMNRPGGDENGSWAQWLETHVEAIDAHVEGVRACAQAVRDAREGRA